MLKRTIKIVIRFTSSGLLILFLFLLFLRSSLNPKVDQKLVAQIIKEVKSSPKVPEQFAEFFNQYHNNQKLIPHLYNTFNSNKSECPCVWASSMFHIKSERSILSNQYVYASQILKKSTIGNV